MDVADGALELLEDLIGCSLEEAKALLEGGSRRVHPQKHERPGNSGVPHGSRGQAT
jgi:hypothetical protein